MDRNMNWDTKNLFTLWQGGWHRRACFIHHLINTFDGDATHTHTHTHTHTQTHYKSIKCTSQTLKH